jgi:hypothetical protein
MSELVLVFGASMVFKLSGWCRAAPAEKQRKNTVSGGYFQTS